MAIPRSEYPRPQWVRSDWMCLNGHWQFEIDTGDSGRERGLADRPLAGEILVPFCPESPLSGVGNRDFLNAVWYRREVEIPSAWAGRRVLLHFQAVDYDATVWVNGKEVARHRGGFTPFTCEITEAAGPGQKAVIVVRARDEGHRKYQPAGKQSPRYENYECFYVRTTGIWQSVWLEPVPESYLDRPRITPDVAGRRFFLVQPVRGPRRGLRVRAILRDERGVVAEATVSAEKDFAPALTLEIPVSRVRLWGPGEPNLYDLTVELLDEQGRVVDSAASYAGLRSVTIDGLAVRINGRAVFQRLVLDQGYYPDGILTAPDDEALRRDIELSLQAGFNGARLHQKVFEERFLYHADRLGYLVWGEFGDWGIDRSHAHPTPTFVAQWLEAVERDYNHPCLIGWCPLNETHDRPDDRIHDHDDLMLAMFLAAKAFDATRPVLDTSGYAHRLPEADVYDTHDYDQNPEELRRHYEGLAEGQAWGEQIYPPPTPLARYPKGKPFFVSEFGGTWWNPQAARDEPSWGYGDRPKTEEEFYERFAGLCGVLLDHPCIFGYCYTQLTDVYQEQNGIYYFDRRPKFDVTRLRAVQGRPAAIETLS